MKKKNVFIGVAWPYVNGDIHIGHLAGYLLPADIFARFNRYLGNEVLMVSGSDCFGTPVALEAEKRGAHPSKIVEEYHEKNVELFKKTAISFDLYTRTDTGNHKKIVQDFFLKILEKGCIFKDKTKQYYSPEDEKFLPDRYVEGKCLYCGYTETRSDQCDNCGRVLEVGELENPRSKLSGGKVEIKLSEHYFLDWPKLQKFLENYVENSKNWRDWVLKETGGWLKKGLKPRAITRDLEWGIEIPTERIPENLRLEGAEQKRIYVWFENFIGYFSASVEWAEKNGRDWRNWWYDKNSFHAYFMGKDNLVFHTLFWPGELHLYDENLHLPDFPAINQFLSLEGQKFSKSRGITIDSKYMTETYGLDALRFYLCLIMPENADANFSWSDFVSKNNDLLIGNLGNFINRTLTLAKGLKFNENLAVDAEVGGEASKFIKAAGAALQNFEFKKYAETILALSDFGNKYLSRKEPWFIKEKESVEFLGVAFNSIFIVLSLLLIMKPLLPDAADSLSAFLGVRIEKWPTKEIEEIKSVIGDVNITEVKPLFKKIEPEIVEKEKANLSSSAI